MSKVDVMMEEYRRNLIRALLPFAKMGARLKGDEFNELYSIGFSSGTVRITMQDLKYAQHVCGIKDIER